MGEFDCYIKGGKVHLKSFPRLKAKQLNHHTIPILKERQYDAAVIHVRITDLLKRKPYLSVDSICDDILEITLRCRNHNTGKVFIPSVS